MITMRPYQLDLLHRVRQRAAEGKRVIAVQAATGAGKTKWAAQLARQAQDKGAATLFLVHRRRLVEQISSTLSQFDVDHGVFMRGQVTNGSARCQVASRDTMLSRCFRNEWNGLPPAQLVIVDEAHHAADPNSEYRKILEQYPNAIKILLTATPVGPDGGGLGPWAEALECAAPTTQLVRDGFLMPVRCYAPDRKKRGAKYVRGIAGDLVDSWKEHAEGRPTILFCSRVAHSQDAVAAFAASGISAAHLDAETPDDLRASIFERVANGMIQVISNVGIVGEGVDIPELTCCQIFCEMNSRVRFLQAVGRVMRPSPGKEYGILIDHAGAVFRHGFPDEDNQWTLKGNVDQDFKRKHDAGETEKAYYCKQCHLAYHGTPTCPQCGRQPTKPPRSIFAPPPVDPTNELLVEADRTSGDFSQDAKLRTWFACLATAKKRNGTMGMAAAIYKNKYQEFPPDSFPMIPERWQWKAKVGDLFPDFGRRKHA